MGRAEDLDLTDYVDVGAQEYVKHHTQYDWERLTDMQKFNAREIVMPIVQVVIAAYVEAHPSVDLDWLEG